MITTKTNFTRGCKGNVKGLAAVYSVQYESSIY